MNTFFPQGVPAKLALVLVPWALSSCVASMERGHESSPGASQDDADSGSPAPGEPGSGFTPTARVAAVWAVNDGEKVERDDLAHPDRESNSAWTGSVARLFGGRNEVLGLQIIVEAGPAGIDALRISLPSLRRRGGVEQITWAPPASDPTDYAGRPIQLFSQGYLEVTQPTHASWIVEAGTAAAPADMLGWKPVQLVPENARVGKGGFPLAVAANQNQGFWIDVYIQKDLPAGIYDGSLQVDADGEVRTVPVELEVMGFTLPDENAVDYMLYYEPDQVIEYQGSNLDAQYHRLAHRSRVELVHAYDPISAAAHLGRFDGADFAAAEKYAGPGEGVGNRWIPRSFYGPGSAFDTESDAWAASDAWMSFLAANVPGARTLLYMPDEPSSAEFAEIETIAGYIHANAGPGSQLPILVTHEFTPELASAPSIDIWCTPADAYSPSRAISERGHGDDMWYYNGQRPNVGSLLIDTPATDPRVHGWAAFKHRVPVYFYWHVNHWHHNGQAAPGYDPQQNVWASPKTYDNGASFANGDGVLVYPGQEKIHPAEDRGIDGPVSTIQLANLRRGAQDALYLSMAQKCGLGALVDAALAAIVPEVFDEAGPTVSFPERGDPFEAQRRALAEALVSCAE